MALKNKTHDINKAAAVKLPPQQQQVARASNEHERPLSPVIALKRAASAPPDALRPADILALQRTVGNRAVHRLLAGQAVRPQASESQGRQPIQAKLMIGAANDKYEQEADRVASQIISMDARPASQSIQRESKKEEEDLQRKPSAISITPLVQRKVKPEDEERLKSFIQGQAAEQATAGPGVEKAIQSARGSGQALPQELRARMESAFGVDFSKVRVHIDAESDRLNQSLHSRAFTTGHELFFKRGEYNPASRQGQELIAHELTHVVQQEGNSVRRNVIQRGYKEDLDNAVDNWKKTVNDHNIVDKDTFPKIVNKIGGDKHEGRAQGVRAWSYNHWNKNAASFLELTKTYSAQQFGMGLIKVEMGHDTKHQPDISISSPKADIAEEVKNCSTKDQGDVDKLCKEATQQLGKRKTAPGGQPYTTWRAGIQITDAENPWPYTPTTVPKDKPFPIDLGVTAKKRNLKHDNAPPRTIVVVESKRFGRFQFDL